jgi:hypothetical protein
MNRTANANNVEATNNTKMQRLQQFKQIQKFTPKQSAADRGSHVRVDLLTVPGLRLCVIVLLSVAEVKPAAGDLKFISYSVLISGKQCAE